MLNIAGIKFMGRTVGYSFALEEIKIF